MNLAEWTLGISERRAMWLVGWFKQSLETNKVLVRECMPGLDRMVFVYGVFEYGRPFLAPLYTFAHVHPPSVLQ